MKGLMFEILAEFTASKFSPEITHSSFQMAELGEVLTHNTYPDEAFITAITNIALLSGVNKERLIYDFGRYFIKSPSNQKIYNEYFHKVTCRDFLLDTTLLHHAVRKSLIGCRPPQLRLERTSFNNLIIHYYSKRRLCMLLKGMIQGVAECFREKIKMTEIQCMEKGYDECIINLDFPSMGQ